MGLAGAFSHFRSRCETASLRGVEKAEANLGEVQVSPESKKRP